MGLFVEKYCGSLGSGLEDIKVIILCAVGINSGKKSSAIRIINEFTYRYLLIHRLLVF